MNASVLCDRGSAPLFTPSFTNVIKASERSTDVIDEHARSEKVELELDAFIPRRDAERRRPEGDRVEEEAFMVSERAYFARLEAERRAAWREYHRRQAERLGGILASLIAHHEAQIEKCTDQKGRAA